MPVVSVLIPCYNAADTLGEALESLFHQTFRDFEIVAVEDGSSDGTGQILENWAARDARLRVVSIPHGGIVRALNVGLQGCRAPLIARMDADDIAFPQRLASQVSYLADYPQVAAVGCRVTGFPPGQVREGFRLYIEWINTLLTDADIRREMFVESPLVHPSVMMRTDAVRGVGGYQEHGWPEDYDLWMRLYLAGAQFGKIPETLLAWRERPERLTRTDSRYSVENFLRLKACYLAQGPLVGRDVVWMWGAGMMGRRLSKHLLRQGVPLRAFFDVDPAKIGNTRRGLPIYPGEALVEWWKRFRCPVILAAVGARNARPIVRQRFCNFGLQEGRDWWSVA